MTKWKLVPVDCWRELEPYLGMEVPNWPPENIEELAKKLEEPY